MKTANDVCTSNPLRILDSKNPDMQDVIQKAPVLLDHLGQRLIWRILKVYSNASPQSGSPLKSIQD